MRNRSFWMAPFAVVAMTLALTGCGDDADTSADGDEPTEEAAADDSGTNDAGSDGAGTEDAGSGDVSPEDLDFGGECGFLANFAAGFEETMDPSAMADGGDAYGDLADQFRQVADNAPDEIKDAFQTMADGMADFADAFSGIDLSDPANIDPEALASIEDGFGEEFEAASAEIDAWIDENCSSEG